MTLEDVGYSLRCIILLVRRYLALDARVHAIAYNATLRAVSPRFNQHPKRNATALPGVMRYNNPNPVPLL
jgi:hypothetical protein